MLVHRPIALLRGLLVPVLLTGAVAASPQVLSEQKISDTVGGFNGILNDEDWFGISIAPLGDLDGDGFVDLASGAWRADRGGVDRGEIWVLYMYPNRTVKSSVRINATTGGFTGVLDDGDLFGASITNLGDIDGDGVTDLAVGAPRDDDGASNAGAVWILFLNTNGTVRAHQKISATEGGFTGTLDSGDNFGYSVAAYADYDGDGHDDLLVGSPGDDDGGIGAGAVWLLLLQDDGTVSGHHKIGGQHVGAAAGDNLGCALTSLGHLDGFFGDEFAIGARFGDGRGIDRGEAWIVQMHATDPTLSFFLPVSDATSSLLELEDGDRFGSSICALGPGDGFFEQYLAIGATGDDDGGVNRGAVYVLGLRGSQLISGVGKISAEQGGFNGPLDDRDIFGASGAVLEAMNGGLKATMAVGAALDDDGGTDRGAIWLLEIELRRSSATFRNDSGNQNETGYVADIPTLGGTWTGTVDNSIEDNFVALIVGYATQTELPTPWGVLLVNIGDPGGEVLGPLTKVGAGLVSLSLRITTDLNLCGATLSTQGFSYGKKTIFHNAYDLVLGYE